MNSETKTCALCALKWQVPAISVFLFRIPFICPSCQPLNEMEKWMQIWRDPPADLVTLAVIVSRASRICTDTQVQKDLRDHLTAVASIRFADAILKTLGGVTSVTPDSILKQPKYENLVLRKGTRA